MAPAMADGWFSHINFFRYPERGCNKASSKRKQQDSDAEACKDGSVQVPLPLPPPPPSSISAPQLCSTAVMVGEAYRDRSVPAPSLTILCVPSISEPQLYMSAPLVRPERSCREAAAEGGWVDVDALNRKNPLDCSQCAWDIFNNMREAELRRRPDISFMDSAQPELNPRMRAILVDWMVEVAEEYTLCADTLYQTVNYLDRFLTAHPVSRKDLQLVGVVCLWVASKYEEIYPPSLDDFIAMTEGMVGKEEAIAMEALLLSKLDYELTVPTAKLFLRRLLQVCEPDELLHYLANYLTELSLLDHHMLKFLPSEISAAAVYLSNRILGRAPWHATLAHYSSYSSDKIRDCVKSLALLHQIMFRNGQLPALHNKYGAKRFCCISEIPPLVKVPDV